MSSSSEGNKPAQKKSAWLRFIVPSLLGVFLFLCPIPSDGSVNIPLGIISSAVASLISPFAAWLVLAATCISAVLSAGCTLIRPAWVKKGSLWAEFFQVSPVYLIIRLLGAVITILVVNGAGPEWIISSSTGGSMISLMETLIAWFFAASFLIPLLMDYGIMDFTGTLLRDLLKPLFRLPGRAAIDLLASWVGNCNVGVVLTTQQYESGYYTDREAILIATCFSATSLPFCLVVSAMLKVDEYFLQMYLILCLVGVLSAAIMCRIWPLHGKWKDEYYPPVGQQVHEKVPDDCNRFQWALTQAVERAQEGPGLKELFLHGIKMFLNIALTLIPVTMCIGTLACCMSTYTPVFRWISYPFQWYYRLLGVEEASLAAQGAVVGFVDMFIPALICSGIEAVRTRFVVCILSLVQIIYITEVGSIMLNSRMPVKLSDLAIIYLEKTIIAIPLILLFTNLFMHF